MRILICIANVPTISPALRVGRLLAESPDVEATILHVIQHDDDRANGEAVLAAASAQMGDTSPQTR